MLSHLKGWGKHQSEKDPTLSVLDSNSEPTLDLLGLKINGTALLPTTEAQLYEPPSILKCLKFSPLSFRIIIQPIVDRIVDSELLIEYKIVIAQGSELNNQLTQSTPGFLLAMANLHHG